MDKVFGSKFHGFSLFLLFLLLPANCFSKELIEKFDFALHAGYRVDELSWNHAGPGGTPNILSELTWKDLGIYQISNEMKLNWYDTNLPVGYALRSRVNYGVITKGENQDSDYNLDNRTDEFSRSNNNADDGSVWDASFAVGLTFFKNSNTFRLTPLLGYSYHEQNLKMTDGYQTIDTSYNDLGPFSGMDSTYDARWKGGFVGCEFELNVTKKISVNSTVEYHDAEYASEANWNLRSDLKHPVSFTNVATDGSGFLVKGGLLYAFNETYLLTVNLDYKKWEAENGFHMKYNSNGTTSTLKFNEVSWESHSASIGLTIRYH